MRAVFWGACVILFCGLVWMSVLQKKATTQPVLTDVKIEAHAIAPVLVGLSGPNFRATVKITTQEELVSLGNWYVAPFKPPVENYINIRTIDGQSLKVARSQIVSMTSTPE